MIVEKIDEIISFTHTNWLEKQISFKSRKRNKSRNDFEKDFHKLLVNAASEKMMEKIRNRLRLELFYKVDI